MGAGTNCQNKLIAMHNLDCPYRPSDLEQRKGRIVRQGNQNPVVEVYNYVTKQTFDSYLWQIVENKQKFISQVMSGKNPTRSMDDIDEIVLNFAEVKAIATGNPLIKRKMELDIELSRLQVLESQYRANRYSLEDRVNKRYPAAVASLNERIKGLSADILTRGDNEGKDFSMRLGKKAFSERKDCGELLLKALASEKYVQQPIGEYKGFTVIAGAKDRFNENYCVHLKGALTYEVEVSGDPVGSIMRIENAVNGLEKSIAERQRELLDMEKQLADAKVQLVRPFENEQALKDVLSELTEVNVQLDLDKTNEAEAVIDENESENGNDDVLGMSDETEDEYEAEV